MCGKAFPVQLPARYIVYVHCDLPAGHEGPCEGRLANHGAPTFY